MRKILLAFTAVMVCIAHAGEPEKMTLQQAVDIAKKNAFAVLSARADAARTGQVIKEAKSALLPRITAEGSYTRYDKESTAQFGMTTIVTRPIDQTQFALKLIQNIDISGVYSLAIAGAYALKMAGDMAVEATINETAQIAKSSFLQLAKAKEIVVVAKERLDNAKSNLNRAKIRNDAGSAAKFDVIKFDAEVSTADQEHIQALNNFLLAQALFNQALARSTDLEVDPISPSGLPVVKGHEKDLIARARAGRPEVLAADNRLKYYTNYRKAQEKSSFPSLSISGNYTHTDSGGFGAQSNQTTATALLSFPIFEGGQIRARVGQAKQDEKKAQIALDQVRLAVEVEAKSAYLNMLNASKIIDSAKKNVELAQEAYRLSTLRYENSISTTYEVSDAALQLSRAKIALVNSTFDYWDAVAKLQKAVAAEDI